MFFTDTICAIATPPGQGGIAILRLSGPDARDYLEKLVPQKTPYEPRRLTYGHLKDADGQRVDECMAVLMPGPRSYTREDVAEIHLHGGQIIAQQALSLAFQLGARPAEPGEFTRRAFLNGRIDLSQAEAVMGLIHAVSKRSAQAAMRQLSGGPSRFIHEALTDLYALLAGLEAAIDYPDEVDEEEAIEGLHSGALALAKRLEDAVDERSARILDGGLNAVLCGRPNAGKSSLLNALIGEERAIVTDIPGTTRDLVTSTLQLNGLRIHLTDTAGLHEACDAVERIGIDRAEKAIVQADAAILLIDQSRPIEDQSFDLSDYPEQTAIALTKGDLPPVIVPEAVRALYPAKPVFCLSSVTGEGLEALKQWLAQQAGDPDNLVITQPRHVHAAQQAAQSLLRAADSLASGQPLDMCAVDLHDALQALGEITGEQVDEKLLDKIFADFCVGK